MNTWPCAPIPVVLLAFGSIDSSSVFLSTDRCPRNNSGRRLARATSPWRDAAPNKRGETAHVNTEYLHHNNSCPSGCAC
eukprot:631056-Amphidinium_carterae.2